MGTTTAAVMNIDERIVRSGVKALLDIIEKSKNNNTLFDDDSPIFLQFCSIKIGRTPSRTLRIPLSHSLLKDSGEVCLIVEDMKGRKPKEYEKTIEHYENLLSEKGVTNIKTIMTYYQLRTDYSEYELKRKLVELYDTFLVDGKLCGYVVQKLGKIFQSKRKLPIPVRLNTTDLKDHLKFALSKTSTNLHPRGDNFVIQIAHSDMNEDQIYENIIDVCKTLSKEFPGGWINIRGLNIKTAKSISIPIYYTLKNSSMFPVPVVKAKRPKAYKAVTDELSTAYDRKVTVLPTGEVVLKKSEQIDQIRAARKRKAVVLDSTVTDDLSADNLSDLSEHSSDDEDDISDLSEYSDEEDLKIKKSKVEVNKKRKTQGKEENTILEHNISDLPEYSDKEDLKIKKPKVVKMSNKGKAKGKKEKSILEDNITELSIHSDKKDLKVKKSKLVKVINKRKAMRNGEESLLEDNIGELSKRSDKKDLNIKKSKVVKVNNKSKAKGKGEKTILKDDNSDFVEHSGEEDLKIKESKVVTLSNRRKSKRKVENVNLEDTSVSLKNNDNDEIEVKKQMKKLKSKNKNLVIEKGKSVKLTIKKAKTEKKSKAITTVDINNSLEESGLPEPRKQVLVTKKSKAEKLPIKGKTGKVKKILQEKSVNSLEDLQNVISKKPKLKEIRNSIEAVTEDKAMKVKSQKQNTKSPKVLNVGIKNKGKNKTETNVKKSMKVKESARIKQNKIKKRF